MEVGDVLCSMLIVWGVVFGGVRQEKNFKHLLWQEMDQGGIRLPCGFFLRPRRQQEGQGVVLQENDVVTSW